MSSGRRDGYASTSTVPEQIYNQQIFRHFAAQRKGTTLLDISIIPSPSTGALNHRLLEVAKLGPAIFYILFIGTGGDTLWLVARQRTEKSPSIELNFFLVSQKCSEVLLSTQTKQLKVLLGSISLRGYY